jgi:hemerythrin-like domain-containing protein
VNGRQPGERSRSSDVPRRALLLGAGGLAAGAVGAGIALTTTSSAPAMTPAQVDSVATYVPLTEDLMTEHGLLLRILLIYREVVRRIQADEPLPAPARLHQAALIIHDFIEGFHEPLEEGYVFPPLSNGPLGQDVSTLLLQHARGRQQTQAILAETGTRGAALKAGARGRMGAAMATFVRVYEPHEAREDTVIYPAFRSKCSPTEIVQLSKHFADLERQQFGSNGAAEMLARVVSIEKLLGIYDLAQYTPPNLVISH